MLGDLNKSYLYFTPKFYISCFSVSILKLYLKIRKRYSGLRVQKSGRDNFVDDPSSEIRHVFLTEGDVGVS